MLISKLKQRLSGQFIRNVGWLGGAELVNRFLRLGVVVVLARLLTQEDYGLAAVVLTVNDLATVFTLKYGIGDKLIQAQEKDLPVLCETAYWMNWILSGSLFILQCLAAFPISWFYGNSQVILPICVSALIYFSFPIYAVQAALIYRENRLSVTAFCNLLHGLVGSILSVILAFLGLGMWAIVLPIVLTAPIWVWIHCKNHPWRPSSSFTLNRWQEIAGFSMNLLGIQLLNKVRANLDYLLVGRFLGIKELGIYYFAFNAGLGISLNLINAFTWSLFPHLCAVREDFSQFKERYFNSLRTMALIIVPLVTLQSGLAPFYVPIVFGQKWIVAIPILVLVCLSALPRPFAEAASLLLQAVDKTRVTLYFNLIFTVIFAVVLLVAMQGGIIWVAASVLITHLLLLPIFTVWASRHVLVKNSP